MLKIQKAAVLSIQLHTAIAGNRNMIILAPKNRQMSDEIIALEKEFELERMILFSDAVFAIAITLLVIELKFPEIAKGAPPEVILTSFKPVIIRFMGFVLSFVFIGVMWARHLKIFKYLRAYNNGLIFRNLIFIFFIVCFPFSASGITENIRPGFVLPVFIYMLNIGFVSISQFVLCYYLFSKTSALCVDGFLAEKRYVLLQSKYSAIMLSVTIVFMTVLSFIFHDFDHVVLGLYILPFMLIFVKRHLKKYKPVKTEL